MNKSRRRFLGLFGAGMAVPSIPCTMPELVPEIDLVLSSQIVGSVGSGIPMPRAITSMKELVEVFGHPGSLEDQEKSVQRMTDVAQRPYEPFVVRDEDYRYRGDA